MSAASVSDVESTAVILEDGCREWYRRGQLHRDDGPAVIYANGDREWWQNGRCHRTDGPAAIYANGDREWYIDGRPLTEQEFDLYRFRRWAVERELV